MGKETLDGFVMRFFQNSDLYISKRIFQILGFRSDAEFETYPWLTFLPFCFYFLPSITLFKSKNWYLLTVGLYIISMTGVTFIALQTRWDQPRLIMIYVPFLLILFLYSLYDICKKAPWGLQLLVILFIPIVFIAEFNATIKKAEKTCRCLKKPAW